MCKCCVNKNIYKVRSTPEAQLFGEPLWLPDSDAVTAAKNRLGEYGETTENLLSLAAALCGQFRYREAVKTCLKAQETDPTSFAVRRMLAIRYMQSGEPEKSLELFRSLLSETDDKLDVVYRIALCLFYKGDYTAAKLRFEECFPLAKANPEMYIAALYWFVLCAVKLGDNVQEPLGFYAPADISHHAGYDDAVKLFLGKAALSEAEKKSSCDNLMRIMYLYGQYHYCVYIGDRQKAEETFIAALKCDEYWPSFSGLGVWYEYASNLKHWQNHSKNSICAAAAAKSRNK